jgi:tRNA-splicing ligase RtcB
MGTTETRALADVTPHGGQALRRGSRARTTLEAAGLVVSCPSDVELAEEASVAYKDVDRVVVVVDGARIARKVARLLPLGVVKG